MVADMRDCKGKRCNIGDIAILGNHRGIIQWDEFEGAYIVLESGLKRRLKDRRFEIIQKKVRK